MVISPLVSLMRDQVKTLRQRNVTAGYVTDVLKQPVEMALLRQGKLSIVFASPETLLGPLGRELLTSSVYQHNLCGIFVDEGHCVAKW